MPRCALLLGSLILLAVLSPATPARGARPSESLLPNTTKGYVSVPDVDALRAKWDETQLGALTRDPVMQPFVEDLRRQIRSKLDAAGYRLGLTLEDLDGVYGGEVAAALIQPNHDPKQHALALVVDITNREKEARELQAKVAKNMAAKGAQKSVQTVQGVSMTVYTVPKKAGETEGRRVCYFVRDNQLVATDHLETAQGIAGRFAGASKDSLASVPAFQASMAYCAKAPHVLPPQLRWFVEPFGYIEASRAASGGRKKRGTDLVKVLANQGFTAVQGAGGHVSFGVEGQELFHKTFIHAPAANKTGEKYSLAMRMMNFPMSDQLTPQPWMLGDLSSYLTFRWKMQAAFEHSETLIDEIAGAPVFDDIIESLEKDPNGPRVNVRRGFVDFLGERATFFTDYRLPISPQSERWMLAIELTNPAQVARTLDKVMESDPDAKRRVIGKQTVWEIVEVADTEEVEELDIAGPGLSGSKSAAPKRGRDEDEAEEEVNPLFKHVALSVAHGNLLVASHVDFLEGLLNQSGTGVALGATRDYLRVNEALTRIGAGTNSFRFFARTEKAYHPNYELMRLGKMPESETLFGSVLNRWLGPEEEGALREQQIDGRKLPPFEQVRQYFGPAGLFADSYADGWLVAGCLLKRQESGTEPAGPLVSRRANERR